MRLKFQNGGRGTEVVRRTLWFERPPLRAVYLGDRINQKICRASCSHGCANISHSQKRSPPSFLLAFFSSPFRLSVSGLGLAVSFSSSQILYCVLITVPCCWVSASHMDVYQELAGYRTEHAKLERGASCVAAGMIKFKSAFIFCSRSLVGLSWDVGECLNGPQHSFPLF